jgi:hypothetical protein
MSCRGGGATLPMIAAPANRLALDDQRVRIQCDDIDAEWAKPPSIVERPMNRGF